MIFAGSKQVATWRAKRRIRRMGMSAPRYQRGSGAFDKVKFYKLAWDAVGSEFASRHTQYEMFYAGATFVTKGHAFRTYDWNTATSLLDRMLSSYDLADEVGANTDLTSATRAVA